MVDSIHWRVWNFPSVLLPKAPSDAPLHSGPSIGAWMEALEGDTVTGTQNGRREVRIEGFRESLALDMLTPLHASKRWG